MASSSSRSWLKRLKLDFTERAEGSKDHYAEGALVSHARPAPLLPANRPVDGVLDRAATTPLDDADWFESSSSSGP